MDTAAPAIRAVLLLEWTRFRLLELCEKWIDFVFATNNQTISPQGTCHHVHVFIKLIDCNSIEYMHVLGGKVE
jgi:hypothetical protein